LVKSQSLSKVKTLGIDIVPEVHAYAIEGHWDDVGKTLEDTIQKKLKLRLQGDPDALHINVDTLSIDEARFISSFQSRKADTMAVVVSCRSLTREAQNALLKIFEEPTPGTYFFIVVPTMTLLVPTLRSRLYILDHNIESSQNNIAKEFLSLPPADRLGLIENIIKDKDRTAAHDFLDTVLRLLYKQGIRSKSLEEIIKARRYLGTRGASLKLLLEHIALTAPVVS